MPAKYKCSASLTIVVKNKYFAPGGLHNSELMAMVKFRIYYITGLKSERKRFSKKNIVLF